MRRKLLVPLDGSERGEVALPWAVELARAQGLALVLARVVSFPTYAVAGAMGGYVPGEVYDEIIAGEREEADAYLGRIAQRLAEQGLEVETVSRVGAPTEAILDLADERGAAAIAMATHARGGLARVVLGSVAELLLRQAAIPILLVHDRPDRPTRRPALDRILVPLDGSPLAEQALDVARELAGRFATLVLAQVVEPIKREFGTVEGTYSLPDEEATARAAAAAQRYLDGLRQRLGPGVATETVVRAGEPGAEIRALAAAESANPSAGSGQALIVMATHGRTGPSRWMLGSVADEVMRHVEQPVLLVSVRALVARAIGSLGVTDVMTRNVVSVGAAEPPIAALRKLLRRRVSGAPVVDEAGTLVGMVSEYDLLQWQDKLMKAMASAPGPDPADYGRRLGTGSVREIMTHPVVTLDESAPLSAALHIFLERRIRRLPVVRAGKLVGILARSDVLVAVANQWELTANLGAV